ncbi:MAG: InlB B-repeat-containing protein, partial [Pseudoflavonifractor sp.]
MSHRRNNLFVRIFSGILCVCMLTSLMMPAVAVAPADLAGTELVGGAEPTKEPAAEPSKDPAAEPSKEPAAEPSKDPAAEPTKDPAAEPSKEPAAEPSKDPAAEPSGAAGSQALPWSGSGTEDQPYLIADEAGLRALADGVKTNPQGYANTFFKLTGTIALTAPWTAIGTELLPFRGSFDGDGYTVSGLTIGTEFIPVAEGYQGLFGHSAGSIRNITVTGKIYSAGDYVGGVVGRLTDSHSDLRSCNFGASAEDTVSGKNYVGGVVGYNASAAHSGSCKNAGTVTGANWVGGIAGCAGDWFGPIAGGCTVENTGPVHGGRNVGGLAGGTVGAVTFDGTAENTGAVTATASNAGGIFGSCEGALSFGTAAVVKSGGAVTAAANAGGVAGLCMGAITGGAGTDFRLTGAVTAANAGGIAGCVQGAATAEGVTPKITTVSKIRLTDCNVTAGTNVGGIAGLAQGAVSVEHCYNTASVAGGAAGAGGLVGAVDTGAALAVIGSYSYVKRADVVTELPLVGSGAPTITRSYYLAAETTDTAGKPQAVKAAEFASGRLAYLLDQEEPAGRSGIWGQKPGTDPAPQFADGSAHPPVYRLTVEQNEGLPGLSVKPEGTGYDSDTYANSKTVIALTATGLAAEDNLTFRPADTVLPAKSGLHGAYTLEMPPQDLTITYAKEIRVEPSLTWYADPAATAFSLTGEADLVGLAQLVNAGTDDFAGDTLTLTGEIAMTADLWTPIGTKDHPFRGTFAAEGHTISGIRLSSALEDRGLFGTVDGATIRDLTAAGSIKGGKNTGGIAAKATGSTFVRCTNAIGVTGTAGAGGIAGTATDCTLTACTNTAAIKGGDGVGGIVGTAGGSSALTACTNSGSVVGRSKTGGVAGELTAGTAEKPISLTGCANAPSATVQGTGNTGGVAGYTGRYAAFTGCYNAGTVTSTGNYTGGVAGYTGQFNRLTDCYNEKTVTGTGSTGGVVGSMGASGQPVNCYNGASGEVTGTGTPVGGVIAAMNPPDVPVRSLYNAGTVTGSGTYTGGVFGTIAPGAGDFISACYNTGTVRSSGAYAGGVAGLLNASWSYSSGAQPSHLACSWNLGTVTGTGAETYAAGISGENYKIYGYVTDSFNYGTVTARSEDHGAAITAKSPGYNQNCYYLDTAFGATSAGDTAAGKARTMMFLTGAEPPAAVLPTDRAYAARQTAADFRSGAVAYGLDRGGRAQRLGFWGQGGEFPVPTTGEHPILYRLTLSMTGPEEGFAAPANGVSVDGAAAEKGKALVVYRAEGTAVTTAYTLKDGYLLNLITVTASDGTVCPITLDAAGRTFAFSMPLGLDAAVTADFAPAGADPTEKYTVTFDANGGKWADGVTKAVRVTTGHQVALPEPPPTRLGAEGVPVLYAFSGWYQDGACTRPYNPTAAVRGDMTLYAGWKEAAQFQVTFRAGSGTFGDGSTRVAVVTEGERAVKPSDPTWTGHHFRGWYTDEGTTLTYDFAARVSGALTLYAGWTEEGKCTVLFRGGGGTIDGAPTAVVTVDRGSPVSPPTALRAPSGSTTYVFQSWKTAAGPAWDFTAGVTEDMTLVAAWTETPFSNAVGGAYEIPDLATLEALRDAVAAKPNDYDKVTFVLTGDVALPANWTTIGENGNIRSKKGFKGIFDGGGHTITLNPNQTQPLFGAIAGEVKNLKIEGGRSENIIAGLAFCSVKGTIRNCEVQAQLYNGNAGFVYYSQGITIEDCTLKAGSVIDGGTAVAGILSVGSSNGTTFVRRCTVESGVELRGNGSEMSYVGGVGGIMAYGCGEVTDCTSGANLTVTDPDGQAWAGGIVAYGNSAGELRLRGCFNTGNLTATDGNVGGLIGACQAGASIADCGSTGTIAVAGTAGAVGGLVGNGKVAGYVKTGPTLQNSYFLGAIETPNQTGAGVLAGRSNEGDTAVGGSGNYHCLTSRRDLPTGITGQSTGLPAADFSGGRAAYLLDGGAGTHRGAWTQSGARSCPVPGTPSCYEVTAASQGDGSLTLDGGSPLYRKAGAAVNAAATPAVYENREYGPQFANVLKSLTATTEGGR